MKLLITLCLASFLGFFAFQTGPVPSIEPLKIESPDSAADLKLSDPSQVLLVNMIPYDQSDEHGQDSEPFLAVQPEGKLMIGAAYYGESMGGDMLAPLFLSSDGGGSWKLISIINSKGVASQTYSFPARRPASTVRL